MPSLYIHYFALCPGEQYIESATMTRWEKFEYVDFSRLAYYTHTHIHTKKGLVMMSFYLVFDEDEPAFTAENQVKMRWQRQSFS